RRRNPLQLGSGCEGHPRFHLRGCQTRQSMTSGTAEKLRPPKSTTAKTGKKKRKPTLAHRAEYYAMRATIGALRTLPWEVACKIGERLGALGYKPFGIRKRVVERQIAAAFPDLDHEGVVTLSRQSYQSLGRSFVESALFDSLGKDGVLGLVDEEEGWHHIDDAMSQGKGIVFVTGHIGNWE